jgi:hypothetical protein
VKSGEGSIEIGRRGYGMFPERVWGRIKIDGFG